MNDKNIIIPYENLLLFQLVIYIYSYNFHSLWILCDFIIIFNLFYILQHSVFRKYPFMLFILVLLFLYFLYSVSKNGFYLINLLSFWDNYKHIIVFVFPFYLIKKISAERKRKFVQKLFIISCITFFIQVIVVFYQHAKHIFFDNVAGTLGDGSTHALGYFTLFMIIFLISHKKSLLLILLVFSLSIIVNFYAENVGFYLLLILSLLFVLGNQVSKKAKIALFGGVLAFLMIVIVTASKGNVFNHYLGRVTAFSVTESYGGAAKLKPDRSVMMGYAAFLGGIEGKGFGPYSEIYGQEGWQFNNLKLDQICISEGTHLVAEIGVIGLFLTFILYISLFNREFKNRQVKMYSIIFFVLAMFYNRFLIDERIFFFFFLTIFIWVLSMDEDIKITEKLITAK